MAEIVQKQTPAGSAGWRITSKIVAGTKEMLSAAKIIAELFVPPVNHVDRVQHLGSSSIPVMGKYLSISQTTSPDHDMFSEVVGIKVPNVDYKTEASIQGSTKYAKVEDSPEPKAKQPRTPESDGANVAPSSRAMRSPTAYALRNQKLTGSNATREPAINGGNPFFVDLNAAPVNLQAMAIKPLKRSLAPPEPDGPNEKKERKGKKTKKPKKIHNSEDIEDEAMFDSPPTLETPLLIAGRPRSRSSTPTGTEARENNIPKRPKRGNKEQNSQLIDINGTAHVKPITKRSFTPESDDEGEEKRKAKKAKRKYETQSEGESLNRSVAPPGSSNNQHKPQGMESEKRIADDTKPTPVNTRKRSVSPPDEEKEKKPKKAKNHHKGQDMKAKVGVADPRPTLVILPKAEKPKKAPKKKYQSYVEDEVDTEPTPVDLSGAVNSLKRVIPLDAEEEAAENKAAKRTKKKPDGDRQIGRYANVDYLDLTAEVDAKMKELEEQREKRRQEIEQRLKHGRESAAAGEYAVAAEDGAGEPEKKKKKLRTKK